MPIIIKSEKKTKNRGTIMLKVSIIGGGSTYTPELFQGFLDRQDLFPIDELWLMDIDQERLRIVGEFVQHLAKVKKAQFNVIISHDQTEAIRNASYVISQLRVGQMKARRDDEYLGMRHGLIGQETTGVGGMAKALRTIPVMLDIAEDIRKFAPNALLINFTNPSGLITEALSRYAPEVNSVGVCNATLTTKMEILDRLSEKLGMPIHPEDAEIKTLGLNHLTWFYGFLVHGEEYWPLIMQSLIDEMKNSDEPLFDPQTLSVLGMLPNSYLRYYYYPDKMLKLQEHWPPSRAEVVFEIEAKLLKLYQKKDLNDIPDLLMQRGGAYYSTVATQLMNAHYNNLDETHVLNVRQNGAVPGWPNDWVLEMPCKVTTNGIIPMPATPLAPVCGSLVSRVKAYELMTVEAGVHGNHTSAYEALLTHPLGPSADAIQPVLDDLLETNRNYLPRFFD
jgi:6-phospho-beta-glucosidase